MVGIIGLGYVGLPLALLCAKKGLNVKGYDIDLRKIEKLNNEEIYLKGDYLREWYNLGKKNLFFTDNYLDLKTENIFVICVPTPVDENKIPDFDSVIKSMETVSKIINNGDLVILESTISPGTMNNIVKPILDKSNKKYHLAHCPERIDPGNNGFNVSNIPRNVGGMNAISTTLATQFYRKVLDSQVKEMSSMKVAEATKILENSFRDINIAFINEIAMIFDKLKINTLEVIEGAKTKPFAFMPHYPGIGVGGHCIPVDPYYLIQVAKENNITPKLLEQAREINNNMPKYAIEKLDRFVSKLNLKEPKILVLGISYKQDIDDDRESPYYELIKELKEKKYNFFSYDSHFLDKSKYKSLEESMNNCDIIIIVTAHSEFRTMNITKNVKAIVDGRNILSKDYIRGLGVLYSGIGQ
jgi:UDP-N-acetyl-D-glucosamine dehydrogenase